MGRVRGRWRGEEGSGEERRGAGAARRPSCVSTSLLEQPLQAKTEIHLYVLLRITVFKRCKLFCQW